jgi:multicomponent Na+:H+ antiporter subunit B
VFGLTLIVASGLAGLLFDEPFLSQAFTQIHLPQFGEIELASALVFDTGIFCVVVGGLLTIFSVVGAE